MNRLAGETSPYLLQHAQNPVEWYPWGSEALERARAEDKPILLSIGYSACHWCHVMAHESFEDAATAELMNRLFVNVKVDREERPDLDAVYMNAVVSMTGQGGWPMTVFLMPDGRPFYGGTYFPPEPRMNMPAFQQVLAAVDDVWKTRRDDVTGMAERLTSALGAAAEQAASQDPLTDEILAGAIPTLRYAYDPEWGGFGSAPKFPPSAAIGFLLRQHARTGSEDALAMARGTLDAMSLGGMHDLVGGGFHRYAVDRVWLVPHFEKMLYDNAQLATAYLEAWAATGEPRYRDVAEGDARLPAARDAAPRGRVRLGPGRRHRRRRGLDLRLDAGRPRARARPGRCCDGGGLLRRDSGRELRGCDGASHLGRAARRPGVDQDADARGARRRGPSRAVTTRRSPPGTGSPSPRWPRARGGSSATTCSRPPWPVRRSSTSA